MFQVLLSYNTKATHLNNNTEVFHASAKAKVTQTHWEYSEAQRSQVAAVHVFLPVYYNIPSANS